MHKRRPASAARAALALALLAGACAAAAAQEGEAARPQGFAPARAELNHEVHLQLLVSAEGMADAPRPPQSLDPILRQLRAALPPADYRVAASFINRVRDGGGFDVKNANTSSPGPGQPPNRLAPLIFQFSLAGVKLIDPASAQPSINVQQFRLNMRAPIVTAAVEGAAGGRPTVQYEDVGLNTMLSVREGEPTLVGTLGAPGQNYVLVLTIRRTSR